MKWKTTIGLIFGVVVATAGYGAVWAQEEAEPQEAAEVVQDIPLRSTGNLQVFVESASFRGPEGFTLLEVYSLLDARQLQFVPESGKFVAQIDFMATLKDAEGNRVKHETWTRNVSVENVRELKRTGAFVRDVVGFDLAPGIYQLTYSVEDIYGDTQGTCEGTLVVPNFDLPDLSISHILFASDLEQTDVQGRFVRNGWRVVPNTTRGYLAGKPIRIYFEIYNLNVQADNPNDSFILGYSLTDSSGLAIRSYQAKRILKPGESVVKTETLETEGIKGGAYYLQVQAFDRSNRVHAKTRRRVYLLSEDGPELTEEEQEQLRYFKDIEYVASEKDFKLYHKLESENALMKFLRAFWKKHDPTPGTPLNERLRDHILRLRYADSNFSAEPGKRGAMTDMGRVYIKYGPPDDHEFSPSATGGRAVDTWIYEHSGRYLFIFQDRRGHGVYELVHSTMSGELYNPDWQNSSF